PLVTGVQTCALPICKHLGATLVESVTPGWADDPDIENMSTSFDRAIAQIAPILYPDLLYRLTPAKEPLFPTFAARVKPTEFAPEIGRASCRERRRDR